MAVSVTFAMDMTVRETLDTGVDGAASPVINFSSLNVGDRLSATTTPVASKHNQDNVALVAGAKTIDLTALTGAGGGTVTLSGLKVQLFRVSNRGTAALTVAKGASNGWSLWTSWTVTLPAYSGTGEYPTIMLYVPEGAEDVDATHKTIDFTGTGTNTFDLSLAAG